MATRKPVRSKAFKAGLATRKKVLGADYVERSFKNADPFSRPFQEYATEAAWGMVWTRPGLSLRDREMVTLAALVMDKADGMKLHMPGKWQIEVKLEVDGQADRATFDWEQPAEAER